MSNTIEYILSLRDHVTGVMRKVSIANDEQLAKWAEVQKTVNASNETMKNMGRSLGSLKQRVSALREEQQWIPAKNINAIRTSNIEIKKLEAEIRKLETVNGGKLKQWFGELKQSIPILGQITNPLILVSAGMYKATQFVKGSTEAYKRQNEAESKLAAVMHNTMGAREEDINSILEVCAAQQKLGVIGDEVQLAGAQELSTYLTKKESLQKIIPVMNDMLAQQYGLNASQEQASQIATMLGKVMDGQVGALSRYGYKFDKAQEKILKHGTEAQRAAVLYEVVTAAVGGVNEALADTPEGKLKQQANNLGDIQERIGKLWVTVKGSLSGTFDGLMEKLDSVVVWFEENKETIIAVIQGIVKFIKKAFNAVGWVIEKVTSFFSFLWEKLQEGNPIVVGAAFVLGTLATAIGLMTLKAKLMALWNGICTTATWLWAAAVNGLNLAFLANPITWIIAGIIALIAAIAYVAYTTEGWGKTWSNIMDYMKLGFELFKESISLKWLSIKDEFLSGFEIIEKGWYKLQSLWNKDAANEGLAKLETQRNERLQEIAEAKNKVDDLKKQMTEMTVWEVKSNGKSLKDITAGLKEKLGFGTSPIPGVVDLNSGDDKSGGLSDFGGKAEATATGGTRSTTINIHMGKFFDNMIFNGGFSENAKDIERKMEEVMLRVLYAAQNAG